MKIANIVHDETLVNHTKVDYINYIKYSELEGAFDSSLPTLYVGWSLFKTIYPIKHDTILNKEFTINKVYWEFTFEENKSHHVSGVELFSINAPYYYFRKNYGYKNIDPIFDKIGSVEDLKNHLPHKIDQIYRYKNEMIYLLSRDMVYGINVGMFDFFNMLSSQINTLLEQYTGNIITDSEGEMYSELYKSFPNFEDLKRYTIVLLSKP